MGKRRKIPVDSVSFPVGKCSLLGLWKGSEVAEGKTGRAGRDAIKPEKKKRI